MKKPILGKQTFLPENTERLQAFENFMAKNYSYDFDSRPLYTGRYFIILDEKQPFSNISELLRNNMGLSVASSNDFRNEPITEAKLADADVLFYNELGIALVGGDSEQIKILEETSDRGFYLEPEKIVYVPDEVPSVISAPQATWGIMQTKSDISNYTGKDVKIAVLDTGFDYEHPDFIGRNIQTYSFVPDEEVDDLHGHGTHCIGTACGNTNDTGVRYGVAKDSAIYAGKVLNNEGSGAQAWIVNGMDWAANNGCKVISMSLGSPIFPGQGYDPVYEKTGMNALSKGAVVVAAAGNESRRAWNQFNPVGSPANCPSVLAVAALDSGNNLANFSNRHINPYGEVDIACAGVDIYSSWPMPMGYRTISGTSMATPHVAGILALLWEKYPSASPYEIISELKRISQKLPLPAMDIGSGFAVAP
ncbi:S8 family serine peptidase [Chryseobacterium sp. JM1]|uniref:S8 family serine peptidase n=1 Tax=Chryseobacterium sp. JM1 TaxID=1233950 RepID=UPI00068A25B5|nr:S8 family serine peptidase [Chryseobacterium sp. JM1]